MRLVSLAAVALGVTTMLAGVAPHLMLFCLLMFAVGVTATGYMTTSMTVVQAAAAPEMRGRVSSLLVMANQGTTPFGALLMGVMISTIGVRTTMAMAGASAVLAGWRCWPSRPDGARTKAACRSPRRSSSARSPPEAGARVSRRGPRTLGAARLDIWSMRMDTTDRLALHELVALYGDTIDNRDWDGLGLVFVEDVVWTNPAMPGRDLVGLALVKKFMSRARHPLTHLISNVRVEEKDDGPVVHSRVLLLADDGTASAGEYHDRVVRTPEGWRVRHRSFVARVRPAGDPPAPER